VDKFNLTFNGEILPGQDLAEVKVRFAEALSIEDPSRVDPFFSGKKVTLRRNVDMSTAEAFYTKMHRAGAIVALEAIQKKAVTSAPKTGMDREFHSGSPGNVEQSWPVRSPSRKKSPPAVSGTTRGNAVLQAEEQQRKEAESVAADVEERKRIAAEAAKRKAAEEAARLHAEQKREYEEEVVLAKAKEAERIQTAEVAARKKAAEEAVRKKAEEEAARKKAAEEAARKKAEEKAARKKAAEEATRKKAAEEAARKKATEEATRKKAAEEAARKKAAEEATRKKAAEKAARKKAAEEAARKKAEEEAARKKAAEEAARKKAEEEAARKKAAEEAARKKAEEEAARKKAAEEAARKKAAEEVARKKAAEEAARKKAAEEVARKKAAEEAARKKAAEEVARKKAAEEAARKKAEEEAARKKAAEEAARQKALKLAARKKAAEEAEKQKALKLATKKKAEEKAARLRKELAQQKRQHAEEAAKARADEKRIEDELRALAAAQQAEDAEQAAVLKQEQLREEKQKTLEQTAKIRQEKQAREQAAKQKEEEQRQEQAALDRAAEGSARLEQLQQVVRPQSRPTATPSGELVERSQRRQPGAPNLFSLKPFRNTTEIRQRADKSQQLMKTMYIASVITILALLILGARYALLPPAPATVSGANSMVVGPHSELLISAGTQLFSLDRSGVDTSSYSLAELGINGRAELLGFDRAGGLMLQERHESVSSETWRTLSCNTETKECLSYEPDIFDKQISSYVVDQRTGETFLASPGSGLLTKLGVDGSILGQATVSMQEQAHLILHEGLLYMNSATGPAVSVFRPDNQGFGEQLDEVLLLPPPALEKEQTQIGELLWSAGSWWVAMVNPETGDAGIYRFDPKWNFLSAVPLDEDSQPERLLKWADKVLVLDSRRLPIQRFNSEGKAEAHLIPAALQGYVEGEQHRTQLSQKLWHAGLGFLALLGIGAYILGRLHQVRSLVYKKDKIRGAEPVDDKEKSIRWVNPDDRRPNAYKKITLIYSVLCLSILALITFLALPATIMLAALFLMSGPAVALALLWRSQIGHIGVLKNQLILVDQHNMYHIGGGARVHYRNNFLLMDDIVVFIGTRRLPVFSTKQLAAEIVPLALAGVKVDRKTVGIKLIQSSHPLAQGLYACTACLCAAIMCLLLY